MNKNEYIKNLNTMLKTVLKNKKFWHKKETKKEIEFKNRKKQTLKNDPYFHYLFKE